MANKLKTFWFNISDKLRFLMVGGFNAGVSYLIYACLLYFILGENHYQTALALAWILSSIISFSTQKHFVFQAKGNAILQYVKCCMTWFFSYILNAFLLWLFIEKFKINAYIAQILATGCCAVFNYIMFKVFAFKNSDN